MPLSITDITEIRCNMINITEFYNILNNNGIKFFTGVPDSYLNGFCNFLLNNCEERNVIAANEGNAVAIASGHYMATGEIPLVYMQNSGLGNAVNPLVSLADRLVYSIPMVLLIGWRGRPDSGDWAQHTRQGAITCPLLECMDIPYIILDKETDHDSVLTDLIKKAGKERRTVAIVSPKGVLDGDKGNNIDSDHPLSRGEAIETVLNNMPKDTVFLATTGRATRELFYLRKKRNEDTDHDFLNVGSMGHVSSVALGMALAKPDRKFVVFDGDAAAIMHLGAMTMVSKIHVPNLIHIVLNNGAHESVGGQPSAGNKIDFIKIAEACGYKTIGRPVSTEEELSEACRTIRNCEQAGFIEVRIHKGLSAKLPPLELSHLDAVNGLMAELKK